MDMRHLVFRAFEASSRGGDSRPDSPTPLSAFLSSSVCLSLFLCLPVPAHAQLPTRPGIRQTGGVVQQRSGVGRGAARGGGTPARGRHGAPGASTGSGDSPTLQALTSVLDPCAVTRTSSLPTFSSAPTAGAPPTPHQLLPPVAPTPL